MLTRKKSRNDGSELIEAASAGNAATLRSLLAAKADIEARDLNGHTALVATVLIGSMDCAKILIDAGANIHATDGVATQFLPWPYIVASPHL